MRGPLQAGAATFLCVVAAAGIVALLVADTFAVQVNLGYTAAGLLVYGLVATMGVATRGPFAWVGWASAAVAVAAFGFLMASLWSITEFGDENQTWVKLAGSFSIFAFALADASLVLNLSPTGDRMVAGLVAGTLFAALAVAAMITIAIVGDISAEAYFRVVAVIAVLWALGTALIPLRRGLRGA